MQDQKLLTLCCHSFSGCGRELAAVVSAPKGCQYLIKGCLQPIRTEITQDTKQEIIDSLLTLIPGMGQ